MKKNAGYIQFFLLFIVCHFFSIQSFGQRSPADSLLNFIDSSRTRTSFYLSKNDDPLAVLNENKVMPLAQVTNMMIAIEFAQQATHSSLDENSYVPLSDINKFYMPLLDSEAHTAWMKNETDLQNVRNDSISLLEVARGMVIYNDNANAEYISDILGIDNIKATAQTFGLKHHTLIFPIVSSLFIYQNPNGYSQKHILKKIKHLSDKEYSKEIAAIHERLKEDSCFKEDFVSSDFTPKMQKLWSDKLTSSTVKDYAIVCAVLNDRKMLTGIAYNILSLIIESCMENPEMQKILQHAGMVGGATPYVFNKVAYATALDKKRIELLYFFNNLTPEESENIRRWSDDFDYKILTNNRFRSKVSSMLSD